MADFNEQLPEWQQTGIEPPASKKSTGWQVNDKPPAGWLNWLFTRTYKALVEIRTVFSAHKADSTTHITATERNTWNGKETPGGAQAKADRAQAAAISAAATDASNKAAAAQAAAIAAAAQDATSKANSAQAAAIAAAAADATSKANAAEAAAKAASIPITQRGTAGGVATLDGSGAVVGTGLAFSTTFKQQILYFNFANGTANQKVNLFFTNTSGFIEITIASSFAFYNAKGRLTKRFEGSFDAVGTAHEPTSAYTEVSGNIKHQVSIGEPVWDSDQGKWRVPIESRNNLGNPFAVLFTSQGATGAAIASISAVYTGAATTLPIAVQTIPDDTETRSGYKIQKHKLSENGGSNIWIPEGTNLNSLVQNGYYNGLNLVNQPVAGTMYWYVEVERYSGHADQYVHQRATQLNSSGYRIKTYERMSDSGVWGDWMPTAGDAIFKTQGLVQGNYNDYVTAGTWQIFGAQGNTNGPALTAPWAILDVSVGSNGYITQEVTQVTAPYGKWYRGRTETEWGEWIKVLTNQDSSSFAPAVHEHNYIKSVDKRNIKPNGLVPGTMVAYFADRLGNTGNNMWTDLLVLNSYVDGSGGLVNALSFNKMNTGGMRIEHVQAAPGAADWGTPKSLAYLDEVFPKAGGQLDGPILRIFPPTSGGRNISIFHDVFSGSFAGASVTGALVIVLPSAWDSTMLNLTIKGFNYWTGGAWELTAGGYNFSDESWYNTTARVWGNTPFTRVRFGYDSNRNKCCLILGDAGTIWAYPFFVITDVMVPGSSDWYGKGWASYFTTDMSMLTKMNQPVINYGVTTNLLRDMAPDVLGAANTIAQRDGSGNLYVNNAINFSDNDGIVYYDDTNQMCAKIDGTITEFLHTGNTAALSIPYAVTTGSGTAYSAFFNPAVAALSVGLRVTIKAHAASAGPITLSVNGLEAKAIKKPNGNNPTITAGGVYSLVYDGSVFQLQGEGGEYGNAGAAQVLETHSFGTEYGVVQGSMPLKTASNGDAGAGFGNNHHFAKRVSAQPGVIYLGPVNPTDPPTAFQGDVWIRKDEPGFNPAYWRSDITMFGMQGQIPIQATAAQTITPGTADIVKAAGIYDGPITIAGSPDAIPSNIRAGKVINGQTGTLIEGPRKATGSKATAGTSTSLVDVDGNSGYTVALLTVTGLAFKPSIIIATVTSGVFAGSVTYYRETTGAARFDVTGGTGNFLRRFAPSSNASIYSTNGSFVAPVNCNSGDNVSYIAIE